MLLGEGSRDVDPGVGRSATAEEGLAHLDRALESGLLPLVGHIFVDKVVFGIDDYSRLLTVCFCCPCCCVIRTEMKGLVSAFPNSLVRLPGVRVEVTDECVGCGECVTVCPVENVSVIGGKALIGERCLGCGSCARACSRGFIKVAIEPGAQVQEELRRRVEAGTNIS
jgi:ferredoxin